MKNDSSTRISLLHSLRDAGNQEAWERFVDSYGPMIYSWCGRWNLQTADAEDVTQSLMLELFRQLQKFSYDPSKGKFRSWLKTVTWNTVCDFCRKRQRTVSGDADSGILRRLNDEPAREDLLQRIEQVYDLELLQEAKFRVQNRVADHTWRAFQLTDEGTRSIAEIAQTLEMKIATVYVARSKVLRMLKEEVALLDAESDAT